jgi:hypothetical protein
MSVPSSLVPDGVVAMVRSARILLDLSDGTTAEVEIPKAYWSLGMTTRDESPPAMYDIDFNPFPRVNHWWWVGFQPVEFPELRFTHYPKPDSL